jgi:DNA-binding NarL/FixJ family response regulator
LLKRPGSSEITQLLPKSLNNSKIDHFAICPEVSVIGLSMHEENDMAVSMIKAGAVAYLTKGGATEPLIAAIRSNHKTKIMGQSSGA